VLVPQADNTLTACGYNSNGQLGNNSTVDAHAPVSLGFNRGGSFYTRGSARRATYAFNGDGLRTSKTLAGTTSSFTWDTSGGLPMLLDDGTNSYVYGPDGLPLEQIDRNGVVTWYHHDQLGSSRTLTSSTGAVVGTAPYDAYGNLTASTGKLSAFGFSGEYTDAETGFVYLRARYYDPATGQFISRDPLVALTGSAYGYVGGNPLNGTDPLGLCTLGLFGRHCDIAHTFAVAAVVVGAVALGAARAGCNWRYRRSNLGHVSRDARWGIDRPRLGVNRTESRADEPYLLQGLA